MEHIDSVDWLPADLTTRTVEEFAHGHIDGFFNIPVDELRRGWVSWTSVSLSTSSVRAVCAATLPVVSWPETALTAITSPEASGSMML